MRYLFLGFILASFVSCGKLGLGGGSDPSLSTPPALLEDTVDSTSLRAVVLPQSLPNQYFVSLDWRITKPAVLIRQDRRGEKILCELPECMKPFWDNDIAPGGDIEYRLVSEGKVLAGASVTIPKDLVVRGNVTLSDLGDLKQYRRLFLRSGSKVLTHGPLFLDLDLLISEDAVIETFAESDFAASGPGRPAGEIKITATAATGNLKIISRGEKGGKGAMGTPGVEGGVGLSGSNAVVVDCRVRKTAHQMDSRSCEQFLWIMRNVPRTDPVWRQALTCERPPSNGAVGSTGSAGYPGGPGFNGGDAGPVSIYVSSPIDFQVGIEQIGGAGGDGGDGGVGGQGGPGGAAGEQDATKICGEAKPGPQGMTGKSGPPGQRGVGGRSDFPKEIKLGATPRTT